MAKVAWDRMTRIYDEGYIQSIQIFLFFFLFSSFWGFLAV